MKYKSFFDPATQTEKARPDQVLNNAGGYVFKLSPDEQLKRFLVLGSDQPTYYVNAKKLTIDNAACVAACLQLDARATVNTIISMRTRAPKVNSVLFAYAMACSPKYVSNLQDRAYALEQLKKICWTSTQLFEWVAYVKQFRGWGRALKRAVKLWYMERDERGLALQLTKYRQRDGWTHRDVLRLAHPKVIAERSPYLGWAVGKSTLINDPLIQAFNHVQTLDNPAKVAQAITDNDLSWEHIPTPMLKYPEVWEALLPNMGGTAMLRNLGRMTVNGLLTPLSDASKLVVTKLADTIGMRNIHPISVLLASKTYSAGHGQQGKLTWVPDQSICAALETAFQAAFAEIPVNNSRVMLALDISGSMYAPLQCAPNFSCAEATGVMSMVFAKRFPNHFIMGFSDKFIKLPINSSMSLDRVMEAIRSLNFGPTDCSLPALHATAHKMNVDCFIVMTDNETYYGKTHPYAALQKYRSTNLGKGKQIVMGMTSTGFTIADPLDAHSLDVVGFDSGVLPLTQDFIG